MEYIKFNIDQKSVDDLKQKLLDNNLDECVPVLDALVNYSKEKYSVLGNQLMNKNLTEDEKKDLIRKIVVAERKFRHMIDVPNLCVNRVIDKKYPGDIPMLLVTIGILHDIGRIDEIIGQDKNTVFKNKVDHCQLGADILETDKIYDFLNRELVEKYGDLIIKCIRYHGVFKLPEEEFKTPIEQILINDIRLIDKSSTMNSFVYEDIETVIGISKEELGNTCISDVTYDELTTDGKLDRRRKDEEYTPNRHFMSHVSFIYDMNDYSLLVEDWIDKYLSIYNPVNKEDQERKEKIKVKAIEHSRRK